VWFTDPTYGIDSDYEGDKAESEIGASNVYRIDPKSGVVTIVVRDRVRPNGLAFSADEKILYVADTGRSHVPDLPATLTAYDVNSDGASVGESKLFATCPEGVFDGFRCDTEGNVWTSAGTNVFCYASDGKHIGTIPVPELVANVCFGGSKRNRLYICGQTSLYALYTKARGTGI
jgi:gluconolactonase